MSNICIIGAGLAGLSTAIKIKIASPNKQVVILEKKHRESNTQIAGMRFRERLPGKKTNLNELIQLLASRNSDNSTDEMVNFATQIPIELDFWKNLHLLLPGIPSLQTSNEASWFGPQWGNGKGLTILEWMKLIAKNLGIKILEGEVIKLHQEGNSIKGVELLNQQTKESSILRAHQYVLANGSIGGSLFNSTNKEIKNSAQEVAFRSGIPLVGSTTHMIHPFGRCRQDGSPLLGCFATDDLQGYEVRYPDGEVDHEITNLLAEHKTHDFFPEIAKRFGEKGGIVRLISPQGETSWARVSHHYSQIGLETDDSISVIGIENLLVAGDAASWKLTNYAPRFPGLGLSKCLIDAENIRKMLEDSLEDGEEIKIEPYQRISEIKPISKNDQNLLRGINTTFLFQYIFDNQYQSDEWISELIQLGFSGTLVELSKKIAIAHDLHHEGKIQEPFRISIDKSDTIEGSKEGLGNPRNKEQGY
jgi:succinate dehydrogenase/fumarate reductase flavoprotein subunit